MVLLSSSVLIFSKLRSSLHLYFQVIMKASERHQVPSHSISSYNDNFRHGRRNSFEKMGISGYDPEEEDMRGVFMARGPGIELFTFIFCSVHVRHPSSLHPWNSSTDDNFIHG